MLIVLFFKKFGLDADMLELIPLRGEKEAGTCRHDA